MEFLSPIALVLVLPLALLFLNWFLPSRLEVLLRGKNKNESLLLAQQQMDQLRLQLSQALDSHALLTQQPDSLRCG